MTIPVGHILVLACLPVFAQAQSVSVSSDHDSSLIRQLTELEFTLNRLLLEGDLTTYAGYLADDYVRISANGDRQTRGQVLEEFRKSWDTSPTARPTRSEPRVLQVRVYGTTAVLTIHLTLTHQEADRIFTRQSLLTKVFVLRGGRWYLVSNQGTPLKQGGTPP